MTVQRFKLLSQIVVSLNQSLVGITHALEVMVQRLNVKIKILNVLVGYSNSLIKVLILKDFGVLSSEQSLLQLHGLSIRSH